MMIEAMDKVYIMMIEVFQGLINWTDREIEIGHVLIQDARTATWERGAEFDLSQAI